MTTVPFSTATVQFDAALRQAAATARARYAGEASRIHRGLVIALDGGVTLHRDGTASVQSSSDPAVQYTVNGHCDCPDASLAPEGRCKHRWAKALVKKACCLALRYWATYAAPDGTDHQGIATQTPLGWMFVPEDGGEMVYPQAQALALGGNVAIAEAQWAKDGSLPHKICGYVEARPVPQPRLCRKAGETLTTCEGKTVVPLDSESVNYREWLVSIGGDDYCIVEDAGTWTLMQYMSDRRQRWEDAAQSVEAFLSVHQLILGR